MIPSESPDRGYKWLVVGILWFVCFFNYADRQAIFSVFPLIKSQLGLTDVQLGVVGAAFMWMYALFGPFAGWLCDRLPAQDACAGRIGCLVPGHCVDCGLSHLRPVGSLPCPERVGGGGVSPRFDVADRRLSRNRHTLSRYVAASVKRLRGLHRRRHPLRPCWSVLRLAMELHRLRILRTVVRFCRGKVPPGTPRGRSDQQPGSASFSSSPAGSLLDELQDLLRVRPSAC